MAWVVTRNGVVVHRAPQEIDAWAWLRRWCETGQFSLAHALDIGYAVRAEG